MSNNNSKPNNNNNSNQNTNQNYSNYNQNGYNGQNSHNNQYQNYNEQGYQEGYNQQNYNEQGYQEGYNQQYQNYNNSNQQYQNNQQYNYSNQNYQTNNQYNYGNQQNNGQQYQNYPGSTNNQQYQNYGNGQQGFNQQYQNYSNQKNSNFINTPQNLNNNFNPNKKKRSKFIPIISTILGLVLIGSGGLYYYSKTTNKSISSIFSTSKNDDEIYAPILEKYKKSMDNNELGENSEVNKFAIKNYEEYGKEKNYITYSYYDVDEDGKNELIIAEKDKPNSPFAVYSYNSNKIIVLYQAESRNDIPRATFYKDRTIWIHTKEKNYDRYIVYKLNDKKDKYDKIHDITISEKEKKDGKYLDTISNNQFSSLEDFLKNNQRSNDKLDFSKSDYKSVYTYNENKNNSSEDNKDTSKVKYTNSQLALIGRALYRNSTDPGTGDLNYESPFTMGQDNTSLMTSFGTGGSIVQVIRTETGIDIKVLDYDKPVQQRNFKLVKSVTYKEIKEKFKKEDMDRINSAIEKYKKTKNYEQSKSRIKD